MIQVPPTQVATLKAWFQPESPGIGPLIGMHVVHTGHGICLADRWPDPTVLFAETAGNGFLAGNPNAVTPDELRRQVMGFVKADAEFDPLLRTAFPNAGIWDRVQFDLQAPPQFSLPQDYSIRRLDAGDADALEKLSPASSWICKTWGGSRALSASGHAWGAFTSTQIVSVSCTFFLGEVYEDIGVVTEPEFRGLGLSAACAGALCRDIQARGHVPGWSTSPDNLASLRVAEKLGFTNRQQDQVYVLGIATPPTS